MAKRPITSAQGLTRKQLSRAKREALLQRWILIGAAILAVSAIGTVAYGYIDQQYIRPNRAVVTAGDQKITGSQFEAQVKVSYYLQLGGQYTLSMFGMDAQGFSQTILDSMTNDLLVAKKAREMGITVTDQEVEREAQLAFGYDAGTPAPTPTPSETPPPAGGPPTATSTYVYTQTPAPTQTLIPGTTPTPTLTSLPTSTATPTPTGRETATPIPTAQPTSTPLNEEAYNTRFKEFLDAATTATGLTADEFKKAWYEQIRSSLLRKKLLVALDIQTDKEKTILHAAHILLPTEEEAKAALHRIKKGEKFEKVAAEVSTDTTNAYKGGDLGWFGQGVMDQTFEDASLAVAVGKVSDPVQTTFGWHLIKVYARKKLSLTADEKQNQIEEKLSAMLEQWKTDYKVTTEDIWTEFVPDIQ